jgi:hypothetical protein
MRDGDQRAADAQTTEAAACVTVAAGEDAGDLRAESLEAKCRAAVRGALGRGVSPAGGERPGLRQSGWREDAFTIGVGPRTDRAGPERLFHDVRAAGAAVATSQAGVTAGEGAEVAGQIRRADHRRHRLRTAKPGGDGSVIHDAGAPLRTRKRVTHEQPSFQWVGKDLQRPDDDCGGDRSTDLPQRGPGVESAELSNGGGAKEEGGERRREFDRGKLMWT